MILISAPLKRGDNIQSDRRPRPPEQILARACPKRHSLSSYPALCVSSESNVVGARLRGSYINMPCWSIRHNIVLPRRSRESGLLCRDFPNFNSHLLLLRR